jgi:flagellar biosynthesis repressor protein FlbT
MPLKIQLKPKERIIVNGAVIEGHATNRTELVVMNNAAVMRQKHILQEGEAKTPATRLYFAVQLMYIDSDNKGNYLDQFKRYHKDLDDTVTLPVLKRTLGLIADAVATERLYEALKLSRELIKVEAELLKIPPAIASHDDVDDEG